MSAARGPLGVLSCVLLVSLGGCSPAGAGGGSNRLQVVAAFYPLAFAVGRVGGDLVDVENLTPTGVEPHDVELSPGQVGALAEADLVVYLGHGFQPAVEDAVTQVDPGNVLDALAGQGLMTPEDEAGAHLADTIGQSEGEIVDPHVWLDPERMSAIVGSVADRLAELDPDEDGAFRSAAADLTARLSKLDDDYARGLAHCRSHEIVTSHAAFGYLAERYGLTQVSVSGIDPEAEPSPGRLAQVAQFVEDHGITTIFAEELAPTDIADTLGSETGAQIEVLSPLETAPESGDYFSAMETNLRRLREALGCD